jgi:putative alpha-1,2-mannosidase
VTIRLENGKTFTLIAKDSSADNKYIQSVKLNGKPLDQVWFRHADIANGGTLELQMGDTPNRSLGAAPESLPPSSALTQLETLTTK